MCDICACSSHWSAASFLLSLPSQRSSWIMYLDETGVARLPSQQLNSYLYWYVQKLQGKKSKIKF